MVEELVPLLYYIRDNKINNLCNHEDAKFPNLNVHKDKTIKGLSPTEGAIINESNAEY